MKTVPKTVSKTHRPDHSRRPRAALAGFALSAATAFAPAFADDTEVFFGQVDSSININPNVLFVLDTSGSMNKDDGTSETRLERMKDAINNILDNTANVNVGLMRFNGTSGGGAVLYPVTAIDKAVCESDDCGDVSLHARITQENDDVEQVLDTGKMYLDGNILSLGENSSAEQQAVGLRFTNIDIPQGAKITSAKLEFTAKGDSTGPSELIIRADASGNTPEYKITDSNVTNRTGGLERSWTPGDWTADDIYQSADISQVMQEVVNRADWCGTHAMAFTIMGKGTRSAKSYHLSKNEAPALKRQKEKNHHQW